jgi:hypothetical protein
MLFLESGKETVVQRGVESITDGINPGLQVLDQARLLKQVIMSLRIIKKPVTEHK